MSTDGTYQKIEQAPRIISRDLSGRPTRGHPLYRTTVLEIQAKQTEPVFRACRCRPTPSSGRSALIATTPPFSDKLDWTHANGNGLAPGTPQSSRKASKRARGASYASKASKASTHFALTYRAPRSLPFCDDETRFWRLPRCP